MCICKKYCDKNVVLQNSLCLAVVIVDPYHPRICYKNTLGIYGNLILYSFQIFIYNKMFPSQEIVTNLRYISIILLEV